MTYGIENATFTTMMYQGPVPLKPGEKHCPFCRGYAILPISRGWEGRGLSRYGARYEDCAFCDKKGKLR